MLGQTKTMFTSYGSVTMWSVGHRSLGWGRNKFGGVLNGDPRKAILPSKTCLHPTSQHPSIPISPLASR